MSEMQTWRRLVGCSYERDPILEIIERHADKERVDEVLPAIAGMGARAILGSVAKRGAGAAVRSIFAKVADSALGTAIESTVNALVGREPAQVAATTKTELTKAGIDPTTANQIATSMAKNSNTPEGAKEVAGMLTMAKAKPEQFKELIDSLNAAKNNPNDPAAKEALVSVFKDLGKR